MSTRDHDRQRGPSADLRARILSEVARTPSPTRTERRTQGNLVIGAGVLATIALFFVTGRIRPGARPLALVAFAVSSALALALVLGRVAAPETSMLGRPRRTLALTTALVVPLLVLLTFVGVVLWPPPVEDVKPMNHLLCAAITVVQSLVPLAILLIPRRGSDPVHPAMTGALLGVTAGTWAAAMAFLRCQHGAALHCIVAHVLPVLLLAAAGALVGRRLLQVR